MDRDIDLLGEMLAYAEEAVSIAGGRARADLDRDRIVALALMKVVETVGEAAAQVKQPEHFPNIPWREVVSTRHRLVHGYRAVDLDILWSIVQDDLPQLIRTLRQLLGK